MTIYFNKRFIYNKILTSRVFFFTFSQIRANIFYVVENDPSNRKKLGVNANLNIWKAKKGVPIRNTLEGPKEDNK